VNFARRRARGELCQSTGQVTSDDYGSMNQQVLNSEHWKPVARMVHTHCSSKQIVTSNSRITILLLCHRSYTIE